MKIIIQGTLAEIDAIPFRLLGTLSDSPPRFELLLSNLVNIRLRRDPYSSAYRFTADVLNAEEVM
ncbi:hypothetical protein SAMN05216276_107110 [Streptosporangium subroseum]|uniref:Uncharacterized protein n=1 Tax=Streptosporangium subroseum TaxID=106412 RepID=A0A239NVG9_9ACTN|nr:hypothetical protein [Streptosporangium subroseum]SNT58825.1 hypothetical protein SAMN05216276_107110 [Streptosporangium subroseum]